METQKGRRVTGNETVALLAEPTGCVDRTYFVFDSFIVETARFPGNKLTRLFSGANPSLAFLLPSPIFNCLQGVRSQILVPECVLLLDRGCEMVAGKGETMYLGDVQRAPVLCSELRRLNLILSGFGITARVSAIQCC